MNINWEVAWHSDLSGVWIVMQGGDWDACVEQSRIKPDGLWWDAWFSRNQDCTLDVHLGPFKSIAEARDVAHALAEQWLMDEGRVDEAMSLDRTMPDSIDNHYRK